VATHVATDVNLDFRRWVGAKVWEECDNGIDAVERHTDILGYRTHIGIGQVTAASVLSFMEGWDNHS